MAFARRIYSITKINPHKELLLVNSNFLGNKWWFFPVFMFNSTVIWGIESAAGEPVPVHWAGVNISGPVLGEYRGTGGHKPGNVAITVQAATVQVQ